MNCNANSKELEPYTKAYDSRDNTVGAGINQNSNFILDANGV